MTNEQADFYKWLQDLTERSVAEQTRVYQRYSDLAQRVLRGELNDAQVRDDYLRFASEETTRFASDLAQLSLGYYSALLELGRSYNDRFFEQVLHQHPPEPRADPRNGTSEPRQVRLDLRGAAGQEVAASVVIENKHASPAEISLLASDFVDVAGGDPFQAPLRLEPGQLSLGPHQEAEVRLRLLLARELFVPGRLYRATVVVRGYDELELILQVSVDPPAEAAAAAPAASVETAAPEVGTAPRARRRTPGAGSKKSAGSRPRRSRNEAAG